MRDERSRLTETRAILEKLLVVVDIMLEMDSPSKSLKYRFENVFVVYFADPGKARGYSTNTSVIHSFIN